MVVCAPVAALLAGCGGGNARQDADEPKGTWKVDVVDASFPASQRLAKQETMRIRVRNSDDRAIPNLAVTVEGFAKRSDQAGLADASRPVWIIDDGPRGGTTAYLNTWALGRLAAGETKTFEWRATPVKPGAHELKYRVAAGLDGKAKAELASGGVPSGSFSVNVRRAPSQARVDPDSGDVVRD